MWTKLSVVTFAICASILNLTFRPRKALAVIRYYLINVSYLLNISLQICLYLLSELFFNMYFFSGKLLDGHAKLN